MSAFTLTIRIEGEAFRHAGMHEELISCLYRVVSALDQGHTEGVVYSSTMERVGKWEIGE